MNDMNIGDTLLRIKSEYESAIRTATFSGDNYDNGAKAKEALIRSQRLINYLHEFVKGEFLGQGVNTNKIVPRLDSDDPEMSIDGFFKPKKQDICIIPAITLKLETERIITVNVRSQLSSLTKNIDTLYERTFAESMNLHLKYPKQCLGEVYLIPTHEYDDKPMMNNIVRFKKITKIERYIRWFQAINSRSEPSGNDYKYERVALIIVDFRPETPILYSSTEQLIREGLISVGTDVTMSGLTVDKFASDLLNVYSDRFDGKGLD